MFFIVHEVGSLNASLQLATDLKERGHKITYAGLEDSEALIRANGFDFIVLFQQHFPKTSISKLNKEKALLHALDFLRFRPRMQAFFRSFVDYLIAGGDEEFFAATKKVQPDLIIFTGVPFVEWVVLMARAQGIRGIYLRPTLSLCEGTGLPPITSAMIPKHAGSLWQTFRIWLAWKKHKIVDARQTAGLGKLTRKLAAKYQIQDYQWDSVYAKDFSVTLPEIIPFHPSFDFPAPLLPDQHYIGASICLDRHEAEFPWERLHSNKKLVYCALGTYVWHAKSKYRQFFAAVLEAARDLPDQQWVLVTGEALHTDEVGSIPENVIVVNTAPQIALLKRAGVMITHGGANTVKECILLGVPMVIFPLGGDHPGIAARAIYHGLAVRSDFTKLNAIKLRTLIDAATNDPFIRSQLRLMQARVIEMDEAKVGVKLIETLLSPGRNDLPARTGNTFKPVQPDMSTDIFGTAGTTVAKIDKLLAS